MMNDTLFGSSNPFEYAKKLDREYTRLVSSSENKSKEDQVDHALNFSFAAWHLADRVFNYPDTQKALKEQGIENWTAYHKRISRLCPQLSVCYDLSIEYKHYNHGNPKAVKSAAQVSQGGISEILGIPISRVKNFLGVPVSRIASINGIKLSAIGPTLVVTITDGTELDFMDIARVVNEFWQNELESLKT